MANKFPKEKIGISKGSISEMADWIYNELEYHEMYIRNSHEHLTQEREELLDTINQMEIEMEKLKEHVSSMNHAIAALSILVGVISIGLMFMQMM